MRIRPGAMEHHKPRSSQRRVVEYALHAQRVAAVDAEIAAGARAGMNMNRHPKTSALSGDIAEQEVLKTGVDLAGRGRFAQERSVDPIGLHTIDLTEPERP